MCCMKVRGRRRLALTAILVALLSGTEQAAAAAPAASGAYVGECCGGANFEGYATVAKLRVGAGGRTLRGGRRGSYIGCYQDGTLVVLRLRRRVAIEADATFAYEGRSRGRRLRVRGRFLSPDRARIAYSVRPGRTAFGCPAGPRPLRLHRRAGKPEPGGCTAQPARTVISSPVGRVFVQRAVVRWAFLPFAYGCLYSAGTPVALGLDGFDEAGLGQALDHFRLAGPYVAYGCGGNRRDGCWATVSVMDLRDGTVHGRKTLPLSQAGSFEAGTGPSDVELKDNGSVAWIAGFGGQREVAVLDTAGERVLDSGSEIRADSLTLDGSTLTWRNGEETRSAVLD